MITATNVIGIDVSRDWLDGFRLPGLQRFRLANSPAGHEELVSMICQMAGSVQVGFEATGGQEWAVWAALVEARVEARQLPPAQIKAFAMSRGTRAKTDRIDAELIARFMHCPAGACAACCREGRSGPRPGGRCRVINCVLSGP